MPEPDVCEPAEGLDKCDKIFNLYWKENDMGVPCEVPGSGAAALGAAALAIAATLLF